MRRVLKGGIKGVLNGMGKEINELRKVNSMRERSKRRGHEEGDIGKGKVERD